MLLVLPVGFSLVTELVIIDYPPGNLEFGIQVKEIGIFIIRMQ
jgi:hypothetical protein